MLTTVLVGASVVLAILWSYFLFSGYTYAGLALLLIHAITYILFSEKWSPAEIRFVLLSVAVGSGLLIVAQNHAGLLGQFTMGIGLGPSMGSLRLFCGLLLALPVVCTIPIAAKMTENLYLRSLIGAVLVTVPCIFASYNGSMLNYFEWFELYPAVSGFGVWFALAFFLHFAGHQFEVKLENAMALRLYILWIGSQLLFTILRVAL